MKIVRIIARLNVGGPSIQAILLTRDLAALGHTTLLVAGSVPSEEGDMAYLAEAMGVRPHFIPQMSRRLSWLGDARAFWAIFRLLRRERPDLVHTHTAKAGTVGRLAAFCARVPSVHTFHGHVFHGYFPPWKTRLFLAVERALARITRRIVAISPSQRADLVSRFRVASAAKVAVVPLGFDLAPFLAVAAARNALARPLRVSWVGRLTEIKDPRLFAEVAALAAGREPSMSFHLFGDGGLGPRLAAQLGAAPCLEMHGWRRDMASVYRNTDILVLTSRNEGTPVAIIEAMAAGCAVIAAAVGGVPDLFVGEGRPHAGFVAFDNGIAVTRREAANFVDALLFLATDPGLRSRMGRAASRFAADQFDSRRLVADLLGVYAEALAPA